MQLFVIVMGGRVGGQKKKTSDNTIQYNKKKKKKRKKEKKDQAYHITTKGKGNTRLIFAFINLTCIGFNSG